MARKERFRLRSAPLRAFIGAVCYAKIYRDAKLAVKMTIRLFHASELAIRLGAIGKSWLRLLLKV